MANDTPRLFLERGSSEVPQRRAFAFAASCDRREASPVISTAMLPDADRLLSSRAETDAERHAASGSLAA